MKQYRIAFDNEQTVVYVTAPSLVEAIQEAIDRVTPKLSSAAVAKKI